MQVTVHFYSYCRELTGCDRIMEVVPEGSTVGLLLERVRDRFPRFAAMRDSVLVAVDVEYQDRAYVLREGDEVSLFPPVQGG